MSGTSWEQLVGEAVCVMDIDVVPYVIHNVLVVGHNEDWDHLTEEQQMLIAPENWASGCTPATRRFRSELEGNPRLEAVLRGWTVHLFTTNPKHEDIDFGKHGRIWAHVWRKGANMVGLLNESEYNDVGEVRLAVIGNDKKSIKAFKKNFELSGKIEKKDSITQA